jgi:hypothetical protein
MYVTIPRLIHVMTYYEYIDISIDLYTFIMRYIHYTSLLM